MKKLIFIILSVLFLCLSAPSGIVLDGAVNAVNPAVANIETTAMVSAESVCEADTNLNYMIQARNQPEMFTPKSEVVSVLKCPLSSPEDYIEHI